jgi:hypothetical protein
MTIAGSQNDRRRIVVVGPCASGKSTLVDGLRQLGYDAHVCGQEHSEIPTLWQHGQPAIVIMLEVDLATVRQRRGADWPASLYATQLGRLANVRNAALTVIDSGRLSPSEVLIAAVAALERDGL